MKEGESSFHAHLEPSQEVTKRMLQEVFFIGICHDLSEVKIEDPDPPFNKK